MCVKDAIAFAFLGLGAGSFFALMATGLVVAYKGSGVINFAHGSVAMYAAFTFNYLRIDGRLRLPWVDILPTHQVNLPVQITISSGGKVNVWLAVLLALAMSALLGVGMHYLVFRPLRNAAPLGKVIGAIGVMLYLQGVALVNFGSENPQPKSLLLPDTLFKNFLGFGKPMPGENLGLFIMAVLVGAVLWFNYKYTRFGLATRAAAGNEKGAVLLGYSPERLALFNWIIAAMTAGLAGVFVGSITGALTPTKFTTLIVPALGAALIGSLSSVPIAIAGGVGIGMIQTVTSTWMTGKSWFPDWLQSGATDAIPLVIIVLTLFLRGKSLPIRGNIEERRLPLSPYPKRIGWHVAILVPLGVVLAYGLPGDFVFAGLSGKWSFAFMTSLIAAMLMLSYVLLAGYVGQISMVQLSIAGVSAFFMARMSANGVPSPQDPFAVSGPGLPWPIGATLGIIVAIAVGVLLGIPALRIRGVQLAVVTIAAAVALQTLYFDNSKLTNLMAGSNAAVPPPTFFGVDVGSTGPRGLTDSPKFVTFCVIVLAAMCVIVSNLRRGSTGRRFLAVRANERAAASAGIDVARTKLLAFGIASGLAGVAGVMTAFQQQQISSSNWVYFAGLIALAFAYLGGITSVAGALIGGMLTGSGLISVFGSHQSSGLHTYTPLIGGVGMILTAIIHPSGQAMLFQPLLQYFGRWLKAARVPEWLVVARRLGPYVVLGLALGAIGINPWRTDEWSRPWMMLVGVLLVLFVRSIVVRIRSGGHEPSSDSPAEVSA
jgi:branched-subunit amino acid ABC-type transport system permease component